MLNALVKFFSSLKLTVVLLALGTLLVFCGTIAQVDMGLYRAQNEFFRSFYVWWRPESFKFLFLRTFPIPILLPGGYLVGGLLLINLFVAHLRYYKTGWRKVGIAMIHLGVVLLLLGQLMTDLLSKESMMHIRVGGSANYSEATRRYELAIIDKSESQGDKVVAVPENKLASGASISNPDLPFQIKVNAYYPNSELTTTPTNGFAEIKTSSGSTGLWWRQLGRETQMDRRDMPSGMVELTTPTGSLGSIFVSSMTQPQRFNVGNHSYELSLRPERFYKPFSLNLLEFKFDRYPGTDTPKNFSSRVRLQRPGTGEDREVLIYMNNPLRYNGETYYQADWDHEDEKGTILQVVHNPSWLTPYLSCIMVGLGLVYQFGWHLVEFIMKRRIA